MHLFGRHRLLLCIATCVTSATFMELSTVILVFGQQMGKQSDSGFYLGYISESLLVFLAFLHIFIFNMVISIVKPERMLAIVVLWGKGCVFFTLSKIETQGTCCKTHRLQRLYMCQWAWVVYFSCAWKC